MQSFHHFVPPESVKLLQCWVDDLKVQVVVSKPRKTKLGDFKAQGSKLCITVNNNLNKYSFLITLIHELAHAFVFKKYQNTVSPHGRIWKVTFKSLMFNFLSPDYFPNDILEILSRHMKNPKASTFTDLELAKVLKKYDQAKSLTVSDLAVGDLFQITNGRKFIKGKKIRKRYRCIQQKTNKVYLFHPLTEVFKEQ